MSSTQGHSPSQLCVPFSNQLCTGNLEVTLWHLPIPITYIQPNTSYVLSLPYILFPCPTPTPEAGCQGRANSPKVDGICFNISTSKYAALLGKLALEESVGFLVVLGIMGSEE